MSKRLPKATLSTMSEIHRESAAEPITVDVVPEIVPAGTAYQPFDAELHRAQASIIVERYTTYSALGGGIPLALFDALSVSLVMFNMVRALAAHYRVPFRQDRVKAGIAALIAGVASPSLGGIATQIVGRILPGAWLVNALVSSAAAASMTRYVGQSFVEHFESGGSAFDFDVAKLRTYFKRPATA